MLRANNELCLHCTKPECSGICSAMLEDMGDVKGKRYIKTLTWHGITRSISEWAEIIGISRQALYKQLTGDVGIDEILERISEKQSRDDLPRGAVEQTIIHLSTMPLDYSIYWRQLQKSDGSTGMVARYGTIQSAPTNSVSKPTEARAMPELSLTDEELTKRGWIACVLYTIEQYRHDDRKSASSLKGDILEWRALDGLSIRKISERLNEHESQRKQLGMIKMKRIMDGIIEDVAREAVRRKLL